MEGGPDIAPISDSEENPFLERSSEPLRRGRSAHRNLGFILPLEQVDPGVSRKARKTVGRRSRKLKGKAVVQSRSPSPSSSNLNKNQSTQQTTNPNASIYITPPQIMSRPQSPNGSAAGGPVAGAPNNRKTLLFPGHRNAPKFDEDKPEELPRFFDLMEEYFKEDRVSDDDHRKRLVVRYTGTRTEGEWKALTEFTNGTWGDFKAAVIASYPAAESINKGSLSLLRTEIKKIGKVDVDDLDLLMRLIRTMKSEARKLELAVPRPVHTNRELVEEFCRPLSVLFTERLGHKLDILRESGPQIVTTPQGNIPRDVEDWFTLEEVMEAARKVAQEYKNPYSKGKGFWKTDAETFDRRNASGGTSAYKSEVKLEESIARLNDAVNVQIKQSRSQESRLENLHTMLHDLQHARSSGQSSNNYQRRDNYNMRPAQHSATCHYCKLLGHFQGDCVDLIRHIDLKWVIRNMNGSGVRLPGGAPIPYDPTKSLKEIVEGLHANKPAPGVIPMSRIDQKYFTVATQEAQEEGSMESQDQHFIQELLSRYGPDVLQREINAQGIEEDHDRSYNEADFH